MKICDSMMMNTIKPRFSIYSKIQFHVIRNKMIIIIRINVREVSQIVLLDYYNSMVTLITMIIKMRKNYVKL